jgi:hypothetical protein
MDRSGPMSADKKRPRRNLCYDKAFSSGAEEGRTPDLCIANAALSQLSYRPDRIPKQPSRRTPVPGRSSANQWEEAILGPQVRFVKRPTCRSSR